MLIFPKFLDFSRQNILEVNHLHFVMTDLAIWYDERKKVSLITYVIISPFFFSMMISQLSLEMSIARKNAFVISQNEGCQILFIFSAFNLVTRFSRSSTSFYEPAEQWNYSVEQLLVALIFTLEFIRRTMEETKNKHFEFSRQNSRFHSF